MLQKRLDNDVRIAGFPSLAIVGISDRAPQRHPTQIGRSGSPCSNSTQTSAPIGGQDISPLADRGTSARGTRLAQLEAHDAQHIRHLDQKPATLHGIDIVDHRALLSKEFMSVIAGIHTGTFGVNEINPSRDRVKFCLYSPCLMLWLTLFT